MEKKIFSLIIALMTMLLALPTMAQSTSQTPAERLFARYYDHHSPSVRVINLNKEGIKKLFSGTTEEAKYKIIINHTTSATILFFSSPGTELVSKIQQDISGLKNAGYTKDPTEEASYYLVKNDRVVEQIGMEQENGNVMILITKCDIQKNEFEAINNVAE